MQKMAFTKWSYMRLVCIWQPFGHLLTGTAIPECLLVSVQHLSNFNADCTLWPNVEVIADDITVNGYGSTKEEYPQNHDANLKRSLDQAREQNLKLNKNKLKLHFSEVACMGHLLTSEGLHPDPMKVKAIQELLRPEDKKAVHGKATGMHKLSIPFSAQPGRSS